MAPTQTRSRRELAGQALVKGVALATVRVLYPLKFSAQTETIGRGEIADERARLDAALKRAREELGQVRKRLRGPLRSEVADFVDAHAMILDDPDFIGGIRQGIEQRRMRAEAALKHHRDELLAAFEGIDDPYLRSRGDDVDQVIARVFAALKRGASLPQPTPPAGTAVVLIADALAPDQLDWWHEHGLAGLALTRASPFSHTTILARGWKLPLLIVDPEVFDQARDGDTALIDADGGRLVLEPDAFDLNRYRDAKRASERSERARTHLRAAATCTRDGLALSLKANAEHGDDLALARRINADGIGLYRTEFLYLNRSGLADEEEQFRHYRDAVLAMGGRPVTLRTLDVGADKVLAGILGESNEDNPALGLRGLRLTLRHREIFAAQVRAMLRASAYGPVSILMPMVTSTGEARAALDFIGECRAELEGQGRPLAPTVPLGAMIEVPGAALITDQLAQLFDFLALGSNDLVQYTLAADRNNSRVAGAYDPLHPAVLKLFALVVEHARKARRPLTLCGEIAADLRWTPLLIGLGFNSLSVHPSALLEVRERVLGLHAGALRRRVKRELANGASASLLDL